MKIRLFALAVVVSLALAACNLTSQATAAHVMVSTLIASPAFTVGPEALAGFDGSVPSFDAGDFTFDAGGFDAGSITLPTFSDGGLTIPAQTALVVFFGERVGTDLTQAPMGVANATLTAAAPSGATFTLKDSGGGTHQLTSQDDPTLVYQPDVTWTFTATAESATYVADVEHTPAAEPIPAFITPQGYLDQAAGTDFTFTRPDPPAGEERNLGFTSVFPISVNGGLSTEPTYTDVPQKPLEFLKLVAAPGDWKKTTVVVPGSAFPEANKNYVVVLQTAKLGGAKSDNLFIGSAVIAGTANVLVVKTH